MWGVGFNHIFQYQYQSDAWVSVSGKLKQIDIGKHNLVWGVNKDDYIYKWTGSGWQNIGGRLRHVSVGSDGTIWGVSSSQSVYRRQWKFLETNAW